MKKLINKYIRQLPDGRFRVDIRLSRNDRPRRTFINREDARSFVRKILLEREDEKNVKRGLKRPRLRIIDVINDFEMRDPELKELTRKRYRPIYQFLRDFCTAHSIVYLQDFTITHAEAVKTLVSAPCRDPSGATNEVKSRSPRTINQYLGRFRAIFALAVKLQHITHNPFDAIDNRWVPERQWQIYTAEQQRAFFEVKMPVAYRRVFLFMLHSGVRFNEAQKLVWKDVVLEGTEPYVRVWSVSGRGLKTRKSHREIPINKDLHSVLVAMRGDQLQADLVFTAPEGGKLNHNKLLDCCHKVGAAAGIEEPTLHRWRHSFGTALAQLGHPVQYIQKLMGHASIDQTMEYIHIASKNLGHVVQGLEGAVPTSAPEDDE